MTLIEKLDHLREALGNLVTQFQGKPHIAGLITSYVNQIQELEAVFFQLLVDRWLDNAVGAQLDGFGSIVGEVREGREDLAYRTAIKARIILNLSQGLTEDIIALLRGVAGEVTVEVTDYYPAGFIARITDPINPAEVDVSKLGAILDSGRAGGVHGQVTYHVTGPFRFDSGPGFDVGKYGGAG